MAKRRIEVPAGERFGKLTVIREVGQRGDPRKILCSCSCGNSKIADIYNLVRGKITSCGCSTYDHAPEARAKMLRQRYDQAEISEHGRLCFNCDTWKPWAEFRSDRRRANGKHSTCAECLRWINIMRIFGINKEQWADLYRSQGGVCALCRELDPNQQLSIDHDHSCCGRDHACFQCIRGLLCGTCNRMLGQVERRPLLVSRFSDYLTQRPLLHLAEQSPA